MHLNFLFFWLIVVCVCVCVGRECSGTRDRPTSRSFLWIKSKFPRMTRRLMTAPRHPGGDRAPLTSSLVSCSGSCQRDRLHQQQPVCHMTSVQPSACLYFRVDRAEWGFTSDRSCFTRRQTASRCGAPVGGRRAHTHASPGPTQHHAHTGEVGGG